MLLWLTNILFYEYLQCILTLLLLCIFYLQKMKVALFPLHKLLVFLKDGAMFVADFAYRHKNELIFSYFFLIPYDYFSSTFLMTTMSRTNSSSEHSVTRKVKLLLFLKEIKSSMWIWNFIHFVHTCTHMLANSANTILTPLTVTKENKEFAHNHQESV